MLSNALSKWIKMSPKTVKRRYHQRSFRSCSLMDRLARQPTPQPKASVHSRLLPIARDLSRHLIRVNTIAPGTFDTPMLAQLLRLHAILWLHPFPCRKDSVDLRRCTSGTSHCGKLYLNAETIRLTALFAWLPNKPAYCKQSPPSGGGLS